MKPSVKSDSTHTSQDKAQFSEINVLHLTVTQIDGLLLTASTSDRQEEVKKLKKPMSPILSSPIESEGDSGRKVRVTP